MAIAGQHNRLVKPTRHLADPVMYMAQSPWLELIFIASDSKLPMFVATKSVSSPVIVDNRRMICSTINLVDVPLTDKTWLTDRQLSARHAWIEARPTLPVLIVTPRVYHPLPCKQEHMITATVNLKRINF